jgi:hypothetical protein
MRKSRRGLKALGLSLIAVLAMSIAASAAQAAPTLEEAVWAVEGTSIGTSTETVGCKANGTISLAGTIAETAVTLTAKKVECLSTAATPVLEKAVIKNSGTTALDEGKLRFSEITVDGLGSECKVTEPITTAAINTSLVKAEVTGKVASNLGDTFVPATGTTGTFATVQFLSGCGAAVGSFPVKGSTVGATEKLGVSLLEQPLTFNAAGREAWPGATLNFGGKPATISGSALNFLSGTNKSKKFGAIK